MRMYLKKRKNKNYFRFFIVLIIIFSVFFLFNKISYYLVQFYTNYSETLVRSKITDNINSCVSEEISSILDNSNLYKLTKNNKDEIEIIDYDVAIVNLFLSKVTLEIKDNINELDSNDVFLEIPAFSILNNPLFNNFGPKIKVKIKNIGSIETNIITNVKEYGINNSFVEMFVKISVTEKIILPIVSKDINITTTIPVSYKIIKGKIPSYYSNSGISKNSSMFSIPLD